MINITLPDGKKIEYQSEIKACELLDKLPQKIKKEALAVTVDGAAQGLNFVIDKDAIVSVLTFENEEGKRIYRHGASHMLAQAVKRLYPDAKLAIGPAIDNGFYYDFDIDTPFSLEDLEKIEGEISKIIAENHKIERFTLPKDEALAWADKAGEPYKRELIEELPEGEIISFYTQGEFTDLCAGPHVPTTGAIKNVKLTQVAGAYWRGSEKNKMLQRIYGTAFTSKQELEQYLKMVEELRSRDHRKLGKELDFFSIDEHVGPGLVLWHPKLSIVREEIEIYWRKQHRKHGYQYIYTPNIGMSNLWETSGHLGNYADAMYPPMHLNQKDADEDTRYYIKPMSCPFHIQIYKSRPRSYRELPIRYCELGTCYRFEKSGVLHGMMRVRGFTQDDSHIICTPEQFVEEVVKVLDFAISMNREFGFEKQKVYLSVRDMEDTSTYIGDMATWDIAEQTLENILKEKGLPYQIDVGGAKFYGPAVDIKTVDAFGREWQGTTVQLDMNLPKRFDMSYIGPDGEEHTPIMLHRTLLGSMERFVGTLIEQYAGAFPLWLAPEQVRIIPITDRAAEYAREIYDELFDNDIRVSVDSRNEKMGYKIREAQLEKIPYMIIIGDKESAEGKIALRSRKDGDKGVMELKQFIELALDEIRTKRY